jgi:hypothetical protein
VKFVRDRRQPETSSFRAIVHSLKKSIGVGQLFRSLSRTALHTMKTWFLHDSLRPTAKIYVGGVHGDAPKSSDQDGFTKDVHARIPDLPQEPYPPLLRCVSIDIEEKVATDSQRRYVIPFKERTSLCLCTRDDTWAQSIEVNSNSNGGQTVHSLLRTGLLTKQSSVLKQSQPRTGGQFFLPLCRHPRPLPRNKSTLRMRHHRKVTTIV